MEMVIKWQKKMDEEFFGVIINCVDLGYFLREFLLEDIVFFDVEFLEERDIDSLWMLIFVFQGVKFKKKVMKIKKKFKKQIFEECEVFKCQQEEIFEKEVFLVVDEVELIFDVEFELGIKEVVFDEELDVEKGEKFWKLDFDEKMYLFEKVCVFEFFLNFIFNEILFWVLVLFVFFYVDLLNLERLKQRQGSGYLE